MSRVDFGSILENITPLLLTYNEAPNIARTLEKLSWAKDIVVVDSFSSDETLSILAKHPRVRVYQRKFQGHADQWNYALKETGIETEWVLALDADYVLSLELVEEIKNLKPTSATKGYEVSFKYCINGRPLRGAAYPPVVVLYRREGASYQQDGHSQRVLVRGAIGKLRAPICHDDRKPLSSWVHSQVKYMRLEAKKLLTAGLGTLGWADRLRLLRVVAPFAMLFYCLFVKRSILDGKNGIYYAFQRMFAESLLSLFLLQNDLGLGQEE
jgi:glycosyltransferase involved in cell wall biosynthesis